MDEMCWPVRNVAEFSYCPRLFYFMQVEGVFLPSRDTEEGKSVHRRIDSPSQSSVVSEVDDSPRVARSLVLTSESLGLTGTLDLVEITQNRAVPIEYRKGRPCRHVEWQGQDGWDSHDDGPSLAVAWPTDRAQIGLQALLLEDAGYQVKEGDIYYSQEKVHVRLPVDQALKDEARTVLDAARRCAEGPRPLPLVNDPRCVGCSLQPICLPDEINSERLVEIKSGDKPKRLWPPRCEGIHVIAQQDGVKLGVRGMELRVTDTQGKLVKGIPLASVETLSILGSVQVSTQAIQVLADGAIPVAFLSSAGRLVAMLDPLDSVAATVKRAQVRKFDAADACVELARSLITAKILNQRTLLMRNHPSLPSNVAGELAREEKSLTQSTSLEEIRGHEGRAASLYFEHFPRMFDGHLSSEFDLNGRKRRPPPDPINACLSFAYSMLSKECTGALRLARLEPSIGGFHVSKPRRPALALDLMEPFRPLVADSVTITCFNRGELTDGHFIRTSAGCSLTDSGRRAFFNAWTRRMNTEVTHPIFGYRLSYRRMLILHAQMIAAWLLGEVPTLHFLTTR